LDRKVREQVCSWFNGEIKA